MPGISIYIIEAFTYHGQAYTGNPAGVCILESGDQISDFTKQKIAAQINQPVTAFISKTHMPDTWTICWFAPTVEVPLCGHATFASAYAIFNRLNDNGPSHKEVTFETRGKGQLRASMDPETGLISLDFPLITPIPLLAFIAGSRSDTCEWLQALSAATLGPMLTLDTIADTQVAPDRGFVLLKLRSTGNPEGNAQLLLKVKPDFDEMLAVNTGSFPIYNVIVTVQGWDSNSTDLANGKPQFFSRAFLPWAGINEDSVTGSAHTMLCPYWEQDLRKQGQGQGPSAGAGIRGEQLSKRGGEIMCAIRGAEDTGGKRVQLTGAGRLAMVAEFYIE